MTKVSLKTPAFENTHIHVKYIIYIRTCTPSFFTPELLRILLYANGHPDALVGDDSMQISPKCF